MLQQVSKDVVHLFSFLLRKKMKLTIILFNAWSKSSFSKWFSRMKKWSKSIPLIFLCIISNFSFSSARQNEASKHLRTCVQIPDKYKHIFHEKKLLTFSSFNITSILDDPRRMFLYLNIILCKKKSENT